MELWDWWGDGTHKKVIEKIVSDFNASQDEIFVKHINYPWGDVWKNRTFGFLSFNELYNGMSGP